MDRETVLASLPNSPVALGEAPSIGMFDADPDCEVGRLPPAMDDAGDSAREGLFDDLAEVIVANGADGGSNGSIAYGVLLLEFPVLELKVKKRLLGGVLELLRVVRLEGGWSNPATVFAQPLLAAVVAVVAWFMFKLESGEGESRMGREDAAWDENEVRGDALSDEYRSSRKGKGKRKKSVAV